MAAKKLVVTQTGSTIRGKKQNLAVLHCLGLGRVGRQVELEANPSVVGMLKKVSHLVRVEEASRK